MIPRNATLRMLRLFAALMLIPLGLPSLTEEAQAQDPVMIQGFYWDVTPGGVWYDELIQQAARLGWAQFDGIWLPPPSKGQANQWDVGYMPYDYYDLGEYDSCAGNNTQGQGGCIPTRYGTIHGLKQAIERLQHHGLEVYADIVLNHRGGGTLEPNIHGQWFTNSGGSLYGVDGNTYTAFPLEYGSGRMAWPVGGGNEYFFANTSNNPGNTGDFYADNQLAGFHQMYVNWFGYDVAQHDGAGNNLPMGDSLEVWGDWITNELNLDGYRFDFVKGIHPEYMKRWVNNGARQGNFHVHELYDGNLDRLDTYYNQVQGTTRQPTLFDFSMRFAYKEVLDGGAPIWQWQDVGLINRFGFPFEAIVPFIDNHDFDRCNWEDDCSFDGHSPVVNNKMLAYAHMLTHPGYATVWWRDYFNYGLADEIDELIHIRKNLASGGYHALTRWETGEPWWGMDDGNPMNNPANPWDHMYIGQRTAAGSNPGLIVAINKHPDTWISVWVTQQNGSWASTTLKDLTGNGGGGTTGVQGDGRVRIWAPPNSYTIWVPQSYNLPAQGTMPTPDEPSYHITNFANLQWPAQNVIGNGEEATFYSRIYVHGRTNISETAVSNIQAWIGYGDVGTNPATWPEGAWVEADFNGQNGHLHEYSITLSAVPGTYDVAARFQLGGGDFVYGGFSLAGDQSRGGFWDGETHTSARLMVDNPGIVDGGAGWRMLASPHTITVDQLAAINLVQGIPGYRPNNTDVNLYTGYDGVTEEWIPAAGGSEEILPGQGYIWYMWDVNAHPEGSTSESIELPITLPAPTVGLTTDIPVDLSPGWQLIGNPYTTSLDVSDIVSWTGAVGLTSAVPQFWNPTAATYVLATVTNDRVAPYQGFFVENDDSETLIFPASARSVGGVLHRPSGEPAPLLTFELSGIIGNSFVNDHAAVVTFREDASVGWDGWDVAKLTPLTWPYALIAFEGERLESGVMTTQLKSQDSRPLDESTFDLPVHVAVEGGEAALELRWPRLENLPETASLSLTDNETGHTIDLLTQDSYSFSVVGASRSTPEGLAFAEPVAWRGAPERFTLSYRADGVSNEGGNQDAHAVEIGSIYPNPATQSARVSFSIAESGSVRLMLFDVLGRRVSTMVDGEIAGGSHEAHLDVSGLASGVYVLRLETGAHVTTRRITVAH